MIHNCFKCNLIQAVSDEGTPRRMHSKYNLREIPHEIEQVKDGWLKMRSSLS